MPDTVFCATSPFFGTHDHFTTVILERQMPVEGDPQVFQGVTSLCVLAPPPWHFSSYSVVREHKNALALI